MKSKATSVNKGHAWTGAYCILSLHRLIQWALISGVGFDNDGFPFVWCLMNWSTVRVWYWKEIYICSIYTYVLLFAVLLNNSRLPFGLDFGSSIVLFQD